MRGFSTRANGHSHGGGGAFGDLSPRIPYPTPKGNAMLGKTFKQKMDTALETPEVMRQLHKVLTVIAGFLALIAATLIGREVFRNAH
jgi:hypothetical protein